MASIMIDEVILERGGRRVLDGLSLSVQPGEIYALLGGNGAGKSTTLAALLGFITPNSGTINVEGSDPARAPEQARRRIGYLPENVSLYPHLSARENVEYFLALAGEPRGHTQIESAFDAAGLQQQARDRPLAGFSKGMQQKVAITLAVVRQVPVLLLDEPTSGLDPRATTDFKVLLQRLKARGTCVLMVTHDLLGAADCADRIGFLDAGRIVDEVSRAQGYDIMALHHRYGEAAP